MAIGALPRGIVGRILARGCLLAVSGLAVGIAAAMYAARLAAPMIREVSTTDIATLIAVAVLLLFVSVISTLAPAIRAARVDPVSALRS
jgi:putative ABC transport system permease protein